MGGALVEAGALRLCVVGPFGATGVVNAALAAAAAAAAVMALAAVAASWAVAVGAVLLSLAFP